MIFRQQLNNSGSIHITEIERCRFASFFQGIIYQDNLLTGFIDTTTISKRFVSMLYFEEFDIDLYIDHRLNC